MKKIVANLAILTNSSSFTFAKGENANTIWAGIIKEQRSLYNSDSLTQEVLHMMDQQLMLYIAITWQWRSYTPY